MERAIVGFTVWIYEYLMPDHRHVQARGRGFLEKREPSISQVTTALRKKDVAECESLRSCNPEGIRGSSLVNGDLTTNTTISGGATA